MKETRKQVIKESRLIEMTRSPLMREIRSGAKEIRLMDKMKMMRQEKDSRIKEVLRQIFGAMNDKSFNRCILEDRARQGQGASQCHQADLPECCEHEELVGRQGGPPLKGGQG